jgi:hypothetical protein
MLLLTRVRAELMPFTIKLTFHCYVSLFGPYAGIEWHTNASLDYGVVTRGDRPRFIMESIKQCRGPPKLFMLDKYADLDLLSCLPKIM